MTKIGDFIVTRSMGSYYVRKVTKITAMYVFGEEKTWEHNFRTDKDAVLFSGPEDAAESLCEHLKSSRAMYDEECNSARDRMLKRAEDYIAQATAALKTAE